MSPRQASLPEALFRSFLGHQAYFYLGLIVLYVVYYRFLHPLSKVPGPFWASLSRLWLVKHARSGEMHRTAIALHRRYGPLVRTGPNEVSVSDPQAVKMIYGLATKFPKSNWYRVWQGKRKFDLFAERNESIHTSQRRLVSNLYSMAAVKELEASFDKAITVFVQRMTEQQGRVVDMALWLQLFAFDIIGEITFSKPFGFMKAGKEDGSFRQIDNALRSAIWVGQVPWLYRLNEMLTPLIGNRLAINSRHGGIRQLALREVEQRQGQASSRPDLLAHLFEVQKKKPTEMNDDGVLSMATSNVFAGSDTSAITLRTILYYALKDARVKARLVDEVDRMQHDGQLSNPVTYNQSVAMPYLQACINEALRIHPGVGMTMPRVVPPGGIVSNGRFLPEGTTVGANAWVIHRNESLFGADVDHFQPERWLTDNANDMKASLLAFGGGSRTCLGKNISLMEISKLIPTLIMHFDMQLAEPDTCWEEKCWWFVKQEKMDLILRSRLNA